MVNSETDQGSIASNSEKLDVLVNKLIAPLQVACETRDFGIMSIALNCFQVPVRFFMHTSSLISRNRN